MEDDTVWYVSETKTDGFEYEFSSLETAEFFGLRMSQASGEILKIKSFDKRTGVKQFVKDINPGDFRLQANNRNRQAPPQPARPLSPYERAVDFMGLHGSFTQKDLKSAFRSQAKNKHPDTGGSKELFLELQNHHDTILRQKGW